MSNQPNTSTEKKQNPAKLPEVPLIHAFPTPALVLEPSKERTVKKIYDGEEVSERITIEGVVLRFKDHVAMCPGEHVEALKRKPVYKVEYVFQEDLVGHENEGWAKNFARAMKLRRDICNLPPLEEKIVLPQIKIPVAATA